MWIVHLLIYVIFFVDLLTAGTIIFIERENAAVTWAWLMVLLFIPIGGFVLYALFGQHVSRFRIYKLKKRTHSMIDRLVAYQRRSLKSGGIEYNDPATQDYQDMIYMNLITSYAFYTQDNDIEVFTDGHQKFESLLRAIEGATDHIHLEYYIIRPDVLGRRLMNALIAKAQAGITVRLLYDAVGSAWTPQSFFDPLRTAGGLVAKFFPSRIPYVNFRMNNRNHRKLAIIDGRVGYIGGFNIGDEYLGLNKRFGAWRDTHLLVRGSAILEMQGIFLLDWNAASDYAFEPDARYFVVERHAGNVGMQVVSSGPDSAWEQIRNAYIKMIYAGKRSVYIQTPYFVPDESLATALKTAALSGIDVRIMMPGKPDHKWVYWASKFYLGELLNSGVKCYLYNAGFLHAKTVVVDGRVASVGTANIDIRSFKLNFEVNAIIYDTGTSTKLMETFELDMANCTELTLDGYRKRPRISRIAESCARLLSPIL